MSLYFLKLFCLKSNITEPNPSNLLSLFAKMPKNEETYIEINNLKLLKAVAVSSKELHQFTPIRINIGKTESYI